MPRLKVETCKRSRKPVELPLLSPANLRKQGCMELTAYDNDRELRQSDEFTR